MITVNEIKPFTTNHPECLAGEIYLGNFTPEEAMHVGFRTKHAGCHAYCLDGSPYPFQVRHEVLPNFADIAEFNEVASKQ